MADNLITVADKGKLITSNVANCFLDPTGFAVGDFFYLKAAYGEPGDYTELNIIPNKPDLFEFTDENISVAQEQMALQKDAMIMITKVANTRFHVPEPGIVYM